MMCYDGKDGCCDLKCQVEKTKEGVQIQLTSPDKEKAEALHQLLDAVCKLCCK